jgi:hypothetical protein
MCIKILKCPELDNCIMMLPGALLIFSVLTRVRRYAGIDEVPVLGRQEIAAIYSAKERR